MDFGGNVVYVKGPYDFQPENHLSKDRELERGHNSRKEG
eukprot:CAMPEP_0185277924 /NCGR_PEP_ID=MMETSP1359-20130426/59766_1 /TAXON_ID=552665 /ORGANISM="Bigelowiella longifila, Strain CCMP242" /LENGTH=38 /DNA_ID= /DNA_START= /DNA_END= /DNA_ORIENTATION=